MPDHGLERQRRHVRPPLVIHEHRDVPQGVHLAAGPAVLTQELVHAMGAGISMSRIQYAPRFFSQALTTNRAPSSARRRSVVVSTCNAAPAFAATSRTCLPMFSTRSAFGSIKTNVASLRIPDLQRGVATPRLNPEPAPIMAMRVFMSFRPSAPA
jgi:hypothetical protein